MGLLQREIEEHGISTISISIVRPITETIKPPRAYFLKYPFGHALGEKFNAKQHLTILTDCLRLLETITEPGTIVDAPYRWRRHKFE